MANLHAALKALGPVDFSDVPKSPEQLDPYLADLFRHAELILESIPIPPPSSSDQVEPHVASNASEITPSNVRSNEPAPELAALQKEWGKPIKLGAKDNPLSMAVYKLSGKDGKGAWFARRSVHEGIGFARFRQSLEMEFQQSIAVEGPAGAGNVRGIGGEIRAEEIDVQGRGKVEVYRLSAQFPGPTTPRDFVTMLVTSDKAMPSNNSRSRTENSSTESPRHYMIISKPCNHPETQPQDGFIRGTYESVEFIREVPRETDTTTSTAGDDLLTSGHQNPISSNPSRRAQPNDHHSDENPVEWIMVTRSDPGGSVPRFMVERGTPGSICSDAKKFLDWACQKSPDKVAEASELSSSVASRPSGLSERKDSYQSWRGSRVAGLDDIEPQPSLETARAPEVEQPVIVQPVKTSAIESDENGYGGVVGAVSATLSAYAPQAVLDRLPGAHAAADPESTYIEEKKVDTISAHKEVTSDDAISIRTTTSFASAEDHLSSDDSEAPTHSSKLSRGKGSHLSHHEKEIAKLEERRAQLTTKFAENRSKHDTFSTEQTAKEDAAHRKAVEKHEKELQKHEEKYQKELRKLEHKQEKERLKLINKQNKQANKDDKMRLTKERDEARKEVDVLKKEVEMLKGVVERLQEQNTTLVAKLGQAGLVN